MRRSEYQLLKLAEELSELAIECNKAAQVVLKNIVLSGERVQDGQPYTNRERLQAETNDVLAMMYLLDLLPDYQHGEFDPIHKMALAKGEKIEKYLKLAIEYGTVDD